MMIFLRLAAVLCFGSVAGCMSSNSDRFPGERSTYPADVEIDHVSFEIIQGCFEQDSAEVSSLASGEILYCGLLNREGVSNVESLLSRDTKLLVIASAGGSLSAPLDLADIVLSRDLAVRVIGPCFSGCASAVFMASRKRSLSSLAILGFHNTASSAAIFADNLFAEDMPKNLGELGGRRDREIDLYRARDVRSELLYDPQVRIETLCVKLGSRHSTSNETVLDISTHFDLWVPSDEYLISHGVHFTGYQPRNPEEAALRYRSSRRGQMVPKMTMNESSLDSKSEANLKSVEVCPEH